MALAARLLLVHFTVPSIRELTELTVVPLGVAAHVTEPPGVAPFATLKVTMNDDGGGGGGGGGGGCGDEFVPLRIVTFADRVVAWPLPPSR